MAKGNKTRLATIETSFLIIMTLDTLLYVQISHWHLD